MFLCTSKYYPPPSPAVNPLPRPLTNALCFLCAFETGVLVHVLALSIQTEKETADVDWKCILMYFQNLSAKEGSFTNIDAMCDGFLT